MLRQMNSKKTALWHWLMIGALVSALFCIGQGCPPPPDDTGDGDIGNNDTPIDDDTPVDDDDNTGDDPGNDDQGGDDQGDSDPANDDTGNDDDDDTDDPGTVIAGVASDEERAAFSSQCALNVITCTTSWPTAVLSVEPMTGQLISSTTTTFIVTDSDGSGNELVQFIGEDSTAGDGATELNFEWSHAATDVDPRSLGAGEVLSTEANPQILLQTGFHYIRLTVRNDIIRDFVFSNDFGLIFENIPSFDFIEVEVEVR